MNSGEGVVSFPVDTDHCGGVLFSWKKSSGNTESQTTECVCHPALPDGLSLWNKGSCHKLVLNDGVTALQMAIISLL